jgi:hypothetical protein
VRHEKEKELISQKHHQEFTLVGMREGGQFGEILVNEGSESEVVASQKEVMARLSNLEKDKEKMVTEPARDATIEFIGGGEAGLKKIEEVVKGFGGVMSKEISAEKSSVEVQPSSAVTINQPVTFKVIVIDQKDDRVTSSSSSFPSSSSSSARIPFVVDLTPTANEDQQQPQQQVFSFSFPSFSFLSSSHFIF